MNPLRVGTHLPDELVKLEVINHPQVPLFQSFRTLLAVDVGCLAILVLRFLGSVHAVVQVVTPVPAADIDWLTKVLPKGFKYMLTQCLHILQLHLCDVFIIDASLLSCFAPKELPQRKML
jgi:hypothetical protein